MSTGRLLLNHLSLLGMEVIQVSSSLPPSEKTFLTLQYKCTKEGVMDKSTVLLVFHENTAQFKDPSM